MPTRCEPLRFASGGRTAGLLEQRVRGIAALDDRHHAVDAAAVGGLEPDAEDDGLRAADERVRTEYRASEGQRAGVEYSEKEATPERAKATAGR